MQASLDMRTLSITRQNAGTPLIVGKTVDFTLNPEGPLRFQDLDGHLLATYTFSFTIGVTADPPTVVSTTPSHGETDVSADLETVSITFSRPMKAGYSISSNFPGYTASWSEQTTITLLRDDLAFPLSPGVTYFFTLNRDGATSFQDLSGVPLQAYTFDFTVKPNYQLLEISANPD